jgi:hypothetical protein
MPSKTIDFASKNVDLDKQDEVAWCYAAILSVLSNWLTNNAGWSPCQIVSWAMVQNLAVGSQPEATQERACNCCQKNKPHACKTATAVSRIQPVLTALGIGYNRLAGPPSFNTIKAQIDLDRPVILGMVREGSPGHVALVIGYDWPRTSASTVTIYDPAAVNIPRYRHLVNLRTMSFTIPYRDLLGSYPTARHKVGHHYVNLALAGALNAAPGWAAYHA